MSIHTKTRWRLHNGELLVEQVSDAVVGLTDAAFQHQLARRALSTTTTRDNNNHDICASTN